MTGNTYEMTSRELSRACFKLYEAARPGTRLEANRIYETEVTMMRLHWLGLMAPTDAAHARLTNLYRFLEQKQQETIG